MLFCRLLIFSKSTFLKNYTWNTIRVSNSLDPDQAKRNVGPDLGPKCLHRLSADNTSRQRVNLLLTNTLCVQTVKTQVRMCRIAGVFAGHVCDKLLLK